MEEVTEFDRACEQVAEKVSVTVPTVYPEALPDDEQELRDLVNRAREQAAYWQQVMTDACFKLDNMQQQKKMELTDRLKGAEAAARSATVSLPDNLFY